MRSRLYFPKIKAKNAGPVDMTRQWRAMTSNGILSAKMTATRVIASFNSAKSVPLSDYLTNSGAPPEHVGHSIHMHETFWEHLHCAYR